MAGDLLPTGAGGSASLAAAPAVGPLLYYGHNSGSNRVFSAFLLVGVVTVLTLSFILTPSAAGWGTHQRLMMPPCMFHYFTHLPCPFCGMTTAFAHMARGEVRAAFGCHVLGPALYLVTWLVGFGALVGLVSGRWPLPDFAMSSRFNRAVLVVILVAWVVNVVRVLLS